MKDIRARVTHQQVAPLVAVLAARIVDVFFVGVTIIPCSKNFPSTFRFCFLGPASFHFSLPLKFYMAVRCLRFCCQLSSNLGHLSNASRRFLFSSRSGWRRRCHLEGVEGKKTNGEKAKKEKKTVSLISIVFYNTPGLPNQESPKR